MQTCYCFILKHQLRPISSARFLPASTGPGCLNREQPVIIIMASREIEKAFQNNMKSELLLKLYLEKLFFFILRTRHVSITIYNDVK